MDGRARRSYADRMMPTSRPCNARILVALAALAAAPAFAFDVDRSSQGKVLLFARAPVAVWLDDEAPPGLTLQQVETALKAAIAAWNGVPGTQPLLTYGGIVRTAPQFDVYVAFDTKYDLGHGDVTGYAERYVAADGKLERVEIALNAANYKWVTAPPAIAGQVPQADVQGVLTHQLGHAIGLSHSRDTTATMYFFGAGASLRTLEADDQRGARFLAAVQPRGEGASCDACRADADCAAGKCYAWPDGSAHCALACDSHDACPLGTSCGTVAGGVTACLPNDLHCHADATSVGLGQPCASDAACGSMRFCVPIGRSAFCTEPCPCPDGAQCAVTSLGNLCVVRGPGKFGAACLVPSDCQSLVCVASVLSGGRCSAGCSAKINCQTGSCGDDGFCSTAGSLATGWPCSSGFDCASGVCYATPGGKFAKACASACKVAGDCGAGTGCSLITADKSLCLPFGPPLENGPCAATGACGNELVCDPSGVGEFGACRKPCDPYLDDQECAPGSRCAYVGSTSKTGGACRPQQEGASAGSACGAGSPCQVGLVCAKAQGSSKAACLPDCAVATGGGCVAGQACASLADSGVTGRGVCVDVPAAYVEVPAMAAGKNFAARTIALPKVVPVAQWQAPPAATKVVGKDDSGCGAAATSSPEVAAFCVLLLVVPALVGAVRRRQGRAGAWPG
jgi:hypothetical protein